MIIHVVDAVFALGVLLLGVACLSYGTVFAFVLVGEWGSRHRERSVVSEATRLVRSDRVRRRPPNESGGAQEP